MTTNSSGAVFFLGTRAHYQVLQQPERFDAENGNASTESIYQNSFAWKDGDVDSAGNYIGERNMGYIDNEATVTDDKELCNGVKRRTKRRQSETVSLCERDRDIEMKPALLNNVNEGDTLKSKSSRRRVNLLTFLTSLARRKRSLKEADQIQYLQHIESALTSCTYRESCRCLECQSRYFECDESDYSSDESDYGVDYSDYAASYTPDYVEEPPQPVDEDEDDEVFIDSPPTDATSTDMLLEAPSEPASSATEAPPPDRREPALEIEVAAGTPVLLNYLLTHPITCSVQ